MDGQWQMNPKRERAALAKQRELALHLAAIRLHEQAAETQHRLGHEDRAQAARRRADRARLLHELALKEQAEEEERWRPHDHRSR